jgi:hypothetical protein
MPYPPYIAPTVAGQEEVRCTQSGGTSTLTWKVHLVGGQGFHVGETLATEGLSGDEWVTVQTSMSTVGVGTAPVVPPASVRTTALYMIHPVSATSATFFNFPVPAISFPCPH